MTEKERENKKVWEGLYSVYGDKIEVINELRHLHESMSRIKDVKLNSGNYPDILEKISALVCHLNTVETYNLSEVEKNVNDN